MRVLAFASLITAVPLAASAQADCNAAARDSVVHVPVAGRPFTPVPSADGCWIFLALARETAADTAHLVVLRRAGGTVTLVRTLNVPGNPAGVALSNDGKTLAVASGQGVLFMDAARLKSGNGDPLLGYLDAGEPLGFIYAIFTKDDQYAFVPAERGLGIAVIDVVKGRATHFDSTSVVGIIPHGNAPVGLALSNDGRFLYSTAQAQGRDWNWPITCRPEGSTPETAPNHTIGAVVVIDVAVATKTPDRSVVSRVGAGCNPVRIVLSPDGARTYVTARGDNTLLVFDTQKLVADTAHALVARVPVGTAPVGVAVFRGGTRVVVTNSNRFLGTASDAQMLTIIDATKVSQGASALVGNIPAGAFPRELRVTADGKTLLASNFNSKTLEIVDLMRVK